MDATPAAAPTPIPTPAPYAAISDKVPLGQKIGYGFGSFIDMWGHWLYPTFAYLVFAVYLGVRPGLVGIVMILNRLFDGVSDPFFGWWSDNTRTRFGRRRPFMLVGAVVAGLGLPLAVAVTPGWGVTHLFGHTIPDYFWFMLASSAIYLPLVSCFNMPYQSLGYELTPDYNERTSIFSVKNIVQKFPELGLFFCGQFVSMSVWVGATYGNVGSRLALLFTTTSAWSAAAADAKPNLLLGSQVFCTIAGVIMMLAGLVAFLTVRERYYGRVVSSKQAKISIKEALGETLRCQPFRLQVLMSIAYAMGTSMVGTLGYTDTLYYVCQGNLSVGNRWNFRMGLAGMAFGFLGVLAYQFIAGRLGKRHGMMCVMGSAAAIFVGCWWLYTPRVVWLQLLATGLIAFTGAGFWMLKDSMVADVVDYDELKGGRRREGSFAACNSWIIKFGMALGSGISFFILDWIGFDSKLGGNQTEHTLFMVRFLFSSIPLVGLVLALLALIRFPLTPARMADIRAQLEARRGTV
jgi:glycoside/pentoside/hexuronide:cation symporter, GPH family